MSSSTILNLVHFNDVYRVTPQKVPGTSKKIDVTQFAELLDSIRNSWPKTSTTTDAKTVEDGLVLFSGDVFSPSIESSVTRGSHMVPVMNELRPDVSLTGNHDFDFGYHHLYKLIEDCKFPWLLSNIKDTDTGGPPQGLSRFKVFERAGIRVGVIGLVEKEWIATVNSWPPNFQYQPMDQVGVELSKLLRDPEGEYKCDLILALTHARIPNDITLAKQLGAVPASDQRCHEHGVDILFGGHDHMYYIGKAISEWEGYNFGEPQLGAEADDGLLIIKSGTDFRDLSSMTVELVDAPEGSARRKLVKSVKGKHHIISSEMPSSESLKQILSTLLKDVGSALKAPVCRSLTEVDCKSGYVRTEESASGNWFADVLKHTYDDALCAEGNGGADGVLICGGTIRGDSVYGPGLITLGDIMEILPFEDPIVVIAVDGATLYTALESALSTWPAQEGRFPIVSGFRVEWDSRRPPNQRIVGIWEERIENESGAESDSDDAASIHSEHTSGTSTPVQKHKPCKGDEVSREPGGKLYKVVTRYYMATGHDGYEALKDCKYVGGIDDEHGQIMSAIVRKYLLGLQYVNRLKAIAAKRKAEAADASRPSDGKPPLSQHASDRAKARWKDAGRRVIARVSRRHNRTNINNALKTTETTEMSSVDCFDGARARKGGGEANRDDAVDNTETKGDLVVVAPVVDGRLKNFGVEDK
ncbi:hypothetical protein M407DRAFT_16826 [Tulasnella calospora MUT 4182]|uniref:5'-Nucleotidase C-terminal domain-containing protein n=1 Tax=Tulasnella calospora MUT 4182 TaxID=1051891 RepID=A0A0C3MKP8_9AGAM|nr:hypothetical protein M407DRAFT_16826 [Tulasnella calospora MUT 4182]